MVTTREASPEELDDAHGAGCDEEASPEELDCIEEIFACFLLAAGGAGDLRTSIEVGRDRVRVVSTGNTVPSGYLTSQPGSGHVTGTAVPLGIAKTGRRVECPRSAWHPHAQRCVAPYVFGQSCSRGRRSVVL